jgi:hypothetical protein
MADGGKRFGSAPAFPPISFSAPLLNPLLLLAFLSQIWHALSVAHLYNDDIQNGGTISREIFLIRASLTIFLLHKWEGHLECLISGL